MKTNKPFAETGGQEPEARRDKNQIVTSPVLKMHLQKVEK